MASTFEHSCSAVLPRRAESVCGDDLSVKCLTAAEMDDELIARWESICDGEAGLSSGYFRPEYFLAAAKAGHHVEVAVIYNRNVVTGFWPFQRGRFGVARPVGGILNDFNGIVAKRSLSGLDMCAVLDACGLNCATFAALVDQGLVKGKTVFERRVSPMINLDCGMDTYLDWLRVNHVSIRKQPQKSRKMTRELGPLRMEIDTRDERVLDQIIAWKRARFRHTRTSDLFRDHRAREILHEIFRMRTAGFRGMASGLWAGDRMVAGHFGFVSGDVLHYWFPAYDADCGKYSPGTALLLQIIRESPSLGIRQIDLTYGYSPLKKRFANDQRQVEACCFAKTPLRGWAGLQQFRLREAMRKMPARELLKRLVRPRWLATLS